MDEALPNMCNAGVAVRVSLRRPVANRRESPLTYPHTDPLTDLRTLASRRASLLTNPHMDPLTDPRTHPGTGPRMDPLTDPR